MPVRPIPREDFLESEKIGCIAFAFTLDLEKRAKELAEQKDSELGWRLGHYNDEGVLTAGMFLPEYTVNFDGHAVKMIGIGGVATLPEYRYGGAIRQIFEVALSEMYEGGAVFSSLFPFSHAYYRKFGYELSELTLRYELPVKALKPYNGPLKIRMLNPGDPMDCIRPVYDACYLRYNLAAYRTDEHWASKAKMDAFKNRSYCYVLEGEEGARGYAMIFAEDAPKETVAVVREIGFVDARALRELLGFIGRLSAKFTTMRINMPSGVPFASLVDEPYDVTPSYSHHLMARIVNVQKALELMRHPDEIAYTLRVADDGIAQNEGVYAVCAKGGRVTVEKRADAREADLVIDIRALSALVLGFLDLEEAEYRSDVTVVGNREALVRAFPKKGVFISEYF